MSEEISNFSDLVSNTNYDFDERKWNDFKATPPPKPNLYQRLYLALVLAPETALFHKSYVDFFYRGQVIETIEYRSIGRLITRQEALDIAQNIYLRAEKERQEATLYESRLLELFWGEDI